MDGLRYSIFEGELCTPPLRSTHAAPSRGTASLPLLRSAKFFFSSARRACPLAAARLRFRATHGQTQPYFSLDEAYEQRAPGGFAGNAYSSFDRAVGALRAARRRGPSFAYDCNVAPSVCELRRVGECSVVGR